MSGVVTLRRQQRQEQRQWSPHRTKASQAEAMRACAVSLLRFDPPLDDEDLVAANDLLELAGDLLTPPRCGWYPRRPAGWRP